MSYSSIRTISCWSLPVLCVVASFFGARLWSVDVIAEARATMPLSPLGRLLIEDDIRQRIALYGMYTNGDGPGGRPRDMQSLATTLVTPDVVSEIHPANGGDPLFLKGRGIFSDAPNEVDPERAKKIAGRHYLVATVFDSVTPTTAETRTTAVYFDATRNVVGPTCKPATDGDCGGTPVRIVMWVYQMSWRNTPDGWQIYRNILRDDN